ncbi:MAG: hypothetical protein HYU48_00420 [Candidatus Levybacteria bacterium]|nr:hypothetical protein [Candidatus Levybacteria bacterium]
MKIVVTHSSPDMDAITSVWLIKRYLPGWEEASVQFVPAGERLGNLKSQISNLKSPIENINGNEVIHVDTGLGPLDHHQIESDKVCGASLTFDFVKRTHNSQLATNNSERIKDKIEAIQRIVKVVVDIDHFKEVFWKDAMADYHEFSLVNILDGLKLQRPGEDAFYVEFVMQNLDALLHEFENRIWAEQEIKTNGKEFKTRFGKAIGFETLNDTVIKLSQKMGHVLVVRKDPRKGYVRIKASPDSKIDLTLAYEQFKKIDPAATWFLHVSRRMLLNGSVKNPKMRATSLPLGDIIKVLEQI